MTLKKRPGEKMHKYMIIVFYMYSTGKWNKILMSFFMRNEGGGPNWAVLDNKSVTLNELAMKARENIL